MCGDIFVSGFKRARSSSDPDEEVLPVDIYTFDDRVETPEKRSSIRGTWIVKDIRSSPNFSATVKHCGRAPT